ENDTIEHLLEIAEKTGDLKDFVNAAYTDSYYKGQTALHVAIEQRIAKFVQMLVKKGADVHAKACGKFFQPNQETCFYFGELPLSLAACTNQPDIVDFLMNNPYQAVDVRERDSHGNTVLHALVSIADNSPENTEFVIAMYDHILFKADQLHPKIKLEEIENNEGLTPLTLAAKTGKVGLLKHIVQREFKGCKHLSRKITEWAYGPVCSSLYDLASLDTYEKNSALEIIVYGSEIPNRLEMLHIEPFNRLIEEKWERFAKRMFLFNFIVYVIYLFILTAVAYHREEGKDLKKKQVGIQAVALYFFIRGSLIIDGYTDQLFFLQAVLFLACALLYCFGQDEYVACLVLCLALSWVNLLYFSRGSKNMGIYNVMIQKVMTYISNKLCSFKFSIAQIIPQMFVMGRSLFAPITGNENCTKPSFKSIYYTTLEMFKFTIGMGNLEFTNQYKYIEVFYVLLILYIVMTYILMLNMLIALMNQRVEEMSVESTTSPGVLLVVTRGAACDVSQQRPTSNKHHSMMQIRSRHYESTVPNTSIPITTIIECVHSCHSLPLYWPVAHRSLRFSDGWVMSSDYYFTAELKCCDPRSRMTKLKFTSALDGLNAATCLVCVTSCTVSL
uniref:Transient receptor potential cation channel subfamily V member 1-like n=1 Tax=Sinocyclocheilus rhinocerous TaxID=307959 RepID=A0A673LWU6_9TELE